MKVGFISLGCSKNLIDTEMAIGIFKDEKFEIVNDPSTAEIIVINTCGFIKSAKEEAIQTILEMAEYKVTGNCQYLIVMGCLVQRYQKELEKALPEVDLFLKIDEYDLFWEKIKELLKYKGEFSTLDFMNRVISTGAKQAYLKIAEGCDNRCTYCAIPYIRGPYKSRKKEEIIKEAEKLIEQGYEEIILIAQDTTKYGIDLYGKESLAMLLKEICKIPKLKWLRFLYAYPESITDELIEVVKKEEKICHYFDIPMQHIADRVLKRMNRKSDSKSIHTLIKKIRKEIPDVILRTTFIVGFPGETEEEFHELCDFIQETQFDKMGVFMYSKEEGTPAAKLKEQIHHATKKRRYQKVMALQQKISREKMKEKLGNVYEILVEHKTSDGKYYIGRSYMDVPDMDGVIFLKADKKDNDLIDQFMKVKIVDVREYDLIAEKDE